MVLAREDAPRIDGDDLDGAREVVGVLLKPAPRLLYPYRRWPIAQIHLLAHAGAV
jgi:hypothetical protein